MEYTTNQKGLITEMEVALKLIKMGYQVSQPLNADSKYDFIVDVNNQLIRIQVKTAHLSPNTKNAIEFKCRSVTGHNITKTTLYSNKEVDYFATYWNNEIYLIPVNECSAAKILRLSKENYRSNSSYAEDYIASEVLKTL